MMTRISFPLIVVAVVLGAGCSNLQPAVEVVATRAVDSVIRQIGELDVKHQEVVGAIADARTEIERLQRIEAENLVYGEDLAADIAALQSEAAQMRAEMEALADHIDGGEPLELADGSIADSSQLKEYAADLITRYEALRSEIAIKQQTFDIYEHSAANARARWTEGKEVVADLERKLDLIKAQGLALKVYEDQPELLTNNGAFEDLIGEAQELVQETQNILDVELSVREQMSSVGAADAQDLIGEALQDQIGDISATGIVTQLRQFGNESATGSE